MFNHLTLPLFPVESTAAAVTVTVWIGVCVVVFFNLRFGWTLSGLVVPGYLVPLLLVKPLSVGIVVVEAVATYLIVRLLSDGWGAVPCWSSFFGRDRFFVIVLVSILVRAGADGWFLPSLGRWLNEVHHLQIDYRNDLHSYGLIVVSLLANYFWKPRLARGMFTASVCVGITYFILRGVVMNYTNFSLGSLQYMYEDISASLLSSPKAYVLVVATAYMASWANLRYSWDFNGILIPALLGLLWHNPMKIFGTCVESLWILLLASWVLRWPVFQRMTVEGGRKLLVFFSIAAFHRLLLAHLLPLITTRSVTDAFGFGYLLTTLMAMKSHDKKITLRVFRATVQTSMVGAVAGSLLGFGLSYLPSDLMGRSATVPDQAATWSELKVDSLWNVLAPQRVRLYMTRVPGSYEPVLPNELTSFHHGVKTLLNYAQRRDPSLLTEAAHWLSGVNFEVAVVNERYLVLRERMSEAEMQAATETLDVSIASSTNGAPAADPNALMAPTVDNVQGTRGWGTFIIDMQASNEMLVEVPAPLEEGSTFDAGYVLFHRLGARALAFSGTSRETNSDRSSDMVTQRSTLLAIFHDLLGNSDVVQVRGWTPRLFASVFGRHHADDLAATASRVFIKNALPASLKLSALEQLIASVDVDWRVTAVPNALRDRTTRGFAELVLSQSDLRRLRNRVGLENPFAQADVTRQNGNLNRWLQDERLLVARQGSNAYRVAAVDEMLFLDEEIVSPLIDVARRVHSFDDLTPEMHERLQSIDLAAQSLGYGIILFHDLSTQQDFFVLRENKPRQRHWGTYVFRAGLTSPYVVEVPRPLYEQQTFQFGLALFERPEASVLMIAGAHPFANPNGTADLMRLANKVSAFHLVRQVLLREFAVEPMLLIQSRAVQAPIDADVVIGTDDGTASYEQASPLLRAIIDQFRADQRQVKLVDGSEMTAGYELGILLQASSLLHSENKQMISLWISPSLRRKYRDSTTLRLAQAEFESLGVRTVTSELFEYLQQSNGAAAGSELPESFSESMRAFRKSSDVVRIYALQRDFPGQRWTRVVDTATDQAFLVVQTSSGQLAAVFNLDGALVDDQAIVVDVSEAEAIRDFARSRRFELRFERKP